MAKTYLNMPGLGSITGRISSITNSFVASLIPILEPSEADIADALDILDLASDDIRCAYCGDAATEWDHLRPLVLDKKPTGHISEIGNLVPACGKCNQSKGNKPWREWIVSDAKLSPKTKRPKGLEERIERLSLYEDWRPREPLNIEAIIGQELWQRHWENHQKVVDTMRESQRLADELRLKVEDSGAI